MSKLQNMNRIPTSCRWLELPDALGSIRLHDGWLEGDDWI